MARPSDYNEKTVEAATMYLEDEWDGSDEVLPTIEGLAVYLDVSRETIYDWASQEDKREFSDIVDKVKALQGKTLINKGLKGEFNATIAKLILSGKHGYVEKTESDIKSDGKALNFGWEKK